MPVQEPQAGGARLGFEDVDDGRHALLGVERRVGSAQAGPVVAGVAKQTIYRWWPSKVEILLDTLIEDSGKRLPVPTQEPTAADIRAYLRGFARFLTRDTAGKVLLALIAQAQHDPGTAARFHERYLAPRRAQERDMLARAADAGEVSPVLGPDATMNALLGPIVYRALTGASIQRDLVDTLVGSLLRPRST
ncbi:TetR-like C-terminal domain-containing protein [Streptomyces sp. NPDC021356]|uniref:TetR-like C-terminal domain-containing protein n=1 Tax=Streptomyces sp. NPDC021356 TaxID=3154900 RepID=UPI0033C23A7B